MGEALLQNKVNLFIMRGGRQAGKGTGLSAMSVDKHSMTGKSDATIPGRGQDYGYDVHGRIRVKNTFQEAPGGLQTATVEFDKTVDIDFMERRRRDQNGWMPVAWISTASAACLASMAVTLRPVMARLPRLSLRLTSPGSTTLRCGPWLLSRSLRRLPRTPRLSTRLLA
jgi:hypothetical protein